MVRKQQAFRWFVLSLWRASQRWNDAACVDLSAAFAYFTLQSFFPLLLIVLSVAARVLGRTDSLDKLIIFVAQILPPSAVDLVDSTLRGLVAQGFGAGLFGVFFLLGCFFLVIDISVGIRAPRFGQYQHSTCNFGCSRF